MNNFLNHFGGSFGREFEAAQNQFANAFHQAAFQNAAMDPQQGGNKGPPPASSKAIPQLPLVIVTPEDLVEKNNRECCICLEE